MASESKEGFEPIAAATTVVIEELSSEDASQLVGTEPSQKSSVEFDQLVFAPWICTDPESKEKVRQWYVFSTCVVSFLPLDFDLVDCRNLDPTLSLTKYTFAGAFLDDKKFVAQFLVDLFNSPSLRASMPVATKQSGQTSLAGVVESVQYEVLSTSVTSMTFFDRLVEEGTSRGGFQTLAPFATALLCRDSHRDRLHSQVH